MNILQEKQKDDKEISIVVQYPQLSKSYTVAVPKNILVADLVQEISQVVMKPPQALTLYKDKQLLNANETLSTYDVKDSGQVLSLHASQIGGFVFK